MSNSNKSSEVLKQAFKLFLEATPRIEQCVNLIDEIEFDGLEANMNLEERSIYGKLRRISYSLDNIVSLSNYLQKPVTAQGVLRLKANGRYDLDGIELTCGQRIEVLLSNDFEEEIKPFWSIVTVEHSDKYAGYYGLPNSFGSYETSKDSGILLNGLEARIRF